MTRLRQSLDVISCMSIVVASSSLALAIEPTPSTQTPTPAPAPAETQAPQPTIGTDVVVLHDGSMVRGTVVEVSAGKEVIMQTLGNIMRTFPMDQVKYWGPIAQAPGMAAAPSAATSARATTQVPDVKLHLTADPSSSGLTWYVKGAVPGLPESAGFTRLCTAPCDISIPSGSYHFAATSGRSTKPSIDGTPVNLTKDTALIATHKDEHGTRAAGWALFGLGLGSASLFAITAASQDTEKCEAVWNTYLRESTLTCKDNEARKTLFLIAGLGGLIALIGLPVALTGDSTNVKSAEAATPAKKTAQVYWPALAGGRLMVSF